MTITGYELSRRWFNYCFDNPDLVRPIHTAIYFFAIEHCNRLGWKDKFGFPSSMAMEAIGVKNWRTYSKALNDLVEWGLISMVQKSKNQYSSNIIAFVKNTKANTKALDKALQKHSQKHSTKQGQSTVSIIKQLNKEQYNKEQLTKLKIKIEELIENSKTEVSIDTLDFIQEPIPRKHYLVFSAEELKQELLNSYEQKEKIMKVTKLSEEEVNNYITEFVDEQDAKEDLERPLKEIRSHLVSWVNIKLKQKKRDEKFNSKAQQRDGNRASRVKILEDIERGKDQRQRTI